MVTRQNSLVASLALLSFSALASADSVYVTAFNLVTGNQQFGTFNLVTGNQQFGTLDLGTGAFQQIRNPADQDFRAWFQLRMDLC